MKTAVLTHTTKHGAESYIAKVGDWATSANEKEIIEKMVKEFRVDYEKSTPDQDAMGEGETLTLIICDEDEIPELDIGSLPPLPISKGEWRYSEEGQEVTASRKGILEGSKKVCSMGDFDKTNTEIKANGRAISAVPEMVQLLAFIRDNVDEDGCVNLSREMDKQWKKAWVKIW